MGNYQFGIYIVRWIRNWKGGIHSWHGDIHEISVPSFGCLEQEIIYKIPIIRRLHTYSWNVIRIYIMRRITWFDISTFQVWLISSRYFIRIVFHTPWSSWCKFRHNFASDGFHTNLNTNSAQDHILSTFLTACVVTSITIPIFNISPILNIQLYSQDSC